MYAHLMDLDFRDFSDVPVILLSLLLWSMSKVLLLAMFIRLFSTNKEYTIVLYIFILWKTPAVIMLVWPFV